MDEVGAVDSDNAETIFAVYVQLTVSFHVQPSRQDFSLPLSEIRDKIFIVLDRGGLAQHVLQPCPYLLNEKSPVPLTVCP